MMTSETKPLDHVTDRTRAATAAKQRMPSGTLSKRIVATLAISPFLIALWYLNGWFSVRGLPIIFGVLTQMMATEMPAWLLSYLWYVGWFMVVVTTIVEVYHFVRRTWSVYNGSVFTPYVDGGLGFYDYVSTALGLFLWSSQVAPLPVTARLVASAVAAVIVTFGVEFVIGKVWSRSR